MLLGILPLLGVRRGWLSPTETGQSRLVAWGLSTGICFGGGVILTSCLTHMLPDVNEVRVVVLREIFPFVTRSDDTEIQTKIMFRSPRRR